MSQYHTHYQSTESPSPESTVPPSHFALLLPPILEVISIYSQSARVCHWPDYTWLSVWFLYIPHISIYYPVSIFLLILLSIILFSSSHVAAKVKSLSLQLSSAPLYTLTTKDAQKNLLFLKMIYNWSIHFKLM